MTPAPRRRRDRWAARGQTHPDTLTAAACRRCHGRVYRADVGPGVVDLDDTCHVTGAGWRWNDTVGEWEPTTINSPPNGWVVYTVHSCTPREGATA